MNVKGIYQYTTTKKYPNNRVTEIVHGKYKNKNVDVYSIYQDNKLTNKLYYVTDALGWLKSKLKYFEDKKCVNEVNSERSKL